MPCALRMVPYFECVAAFQYVGYCNVEENTNKPVACIANDKGSAGLVFRTNLLTVMRVKI